MFVAVPSVVLLWINGHALKATRANRVDLGDGRGALCGLDHHGCHYGHQAPVGALCIFGPAVCDNEGRCVRGTQRGCDRRNDRRLRPLSGRQRAYHRHVSGADVGNGGRIAPDPGGDIFPARISRGNHLVVDHRRAVPAPHRPGGVPASRVSLQEGSSVADKSAELGVADVKAQRKIPDLATAFHQWLEHRRPAIEAYKKKGSAYPVFFVSAQGGGMYAAYHPALSLARLTDQCPEFAHHLFGISSVSGGSLGAAVFAELLRALPATAPNDPASPSTSCSPTRGPEFDNALQTKVGEFFSTDFLSPVIASCIHFRHPEPLRPSAAVRPGSSEGSGVRVRDGMA